MVYIDLCYFTFILSQRSITDSQEAKVTSWLVSDEVLNFLSCTSNGQLFYRHSGRNPVLLFAANLVKVTLKPGYQLRALVLWMFVLAANSFGLEDLLS